MTGLFYGGGGHQFFIQLGAAATVIVWDGVITFVLLKLIGLVVPLRLPDAMLEVGDVAVHGEEVQFPEPEHRARGGNDGACRRTIVAARHDVMPAEVRRL